MKRILLIAIVLFSAHLSRAQQDEQMSMYMYNKLYLNPAYAGSRNAISAVDIGRFQWTGFEGAPNTQWLSVHAPLMRRFLGVGLHAVNDRIGNRSRTSVYGDVCTSIPINDKTSRVAVGLSGGLDIIGYDFSGVQVNSQNDPYFGQVYAETKGNIGAGLYYYSDKHYFGISTPRILEAKSNVMDSVITNIVARHFFISGGYIFDLNSVLKLQPSTMIKYTPGAPITVDVNVSLLMHERLWTGLLYRYHESMGVNVFYEFKNVFGIGYVYDFPINGLRTYQSGSHEIVLRADFRPKKSVYTSPRYF